MCCRVISEKRVKTRKPHRCWGCGRLIQPGNYMDRTVSTRDGVIEATYWCLVCIEVMSRYQEQCHEIYFHEGDFKDYYEDEWNEIQYTLEVEGGILP